MKSKTAKMEIGRSRRSKVFFYLLTFAFSFVFMGCIRVAGKTGVWYKGANDESPKEKSVGFDTQDMVQKDKAPGSIQV